MRALLALMVATGLAGTALSANPQNRTPPVFNVQVESVFVDVFITNNGKPVQGLAASDFELKDNGISQHVELVSVEAQPLLAVLAFDTSGSLAGERLAALRVASQAFVESLKATDEVTLFTFADEIEWPVRPTRDKARVRSALERLQVGGGTSVVDALFAAVLLPATQARSLVVLFTDGEDSMSWLEWRELQVIAERSNALIHVVGLRPAASPSSARFEQHWDLRQLAEKTGGRCWEATSADRLRSSFDAIAEAVSKRYVLRYEPRNVKRPGWHRVDLRLRRNPGHIDARRGYWVADR